MTAPFWRNRALLPRRSALFAALGALTWPLSVVPAVIYEPSPSCCGSFGPWLHAHHLVLAGRWRPRAVAIALTVMRRIVPIAAMMLGMGVGVAVPHRAMMDLDAPPPF